MRFSTYAKVGRVPLIQAVGVQKRKGEMSYTQTRELDPAKSGCFRCDNYRTIEFLQYMPPEIQEEATRRCAGCPHAVYRTVTREVCRHSDEHFGNAPRLKAISLKLLMIYHFAEPDERGFVIGISKKELAEILGCTVRSIGNANYALEKYGYIRYCQEGDSRDCFHVLLNGYKNYGLSMKEGGQGYVTFNREFLQEMLKIKDLNQLRIFLRVALEMDTNCDRQKPLVTTIDYNSLRKFLPDYCKPGIIRKALSALSRLFQVVCKEKTVSLKMNPTYHGRRNYESQIKKCAAQMREYVSELNETMSRINKTHQAKKMINVEDQSRLIRAGIYPQARHRTPSGEWIYFTFCLEEKDFDDLGVLCAVYDIEKVKKCLGYIYEHYLSKRRVENVGELARGLLEQQFRNEAVDFLFANA